MIMGDVSIRELRNQGGQVVARASAGERVIITRDGEPVAELRSLERVPVPAEVLLRRWNVLPDIDPEAFRRDVDAVIDQVW
jgi:prevent-host-death family protein